MHMHGTWSLTGFASVFLAVTAVAGADVGRDANIRVRSTPPTPAPMRSGPYPPGEAVPEHKVDGGVEIAGQVIKDADYAQLKASGYLPMRRELTDAELLSTLKPELGIRTTAELAKRARAKFATYVPSLYWGFRKPGSGKLVGGAGAAYAAHFTQDGAFKVPYLARAAPPNIPMLRWAGSYWNTGDERWARAVRDAFMPYYHANRPPLEKVRNSKATGMWRVLGCGARVPFLVESYALVSPSPEWSDADHTTFAKAMLERARFLRYTTVPVGPWVPYNCFGYGNWLLYQLEGLLAIAAFFPEFSEAEGWLAHATAGIGQHADWVVMPDSGFDEYSYSYCGQVAGQLQTCFNTFRQARLPLPPRFEENMLRFLELFLKIAAPGCEPLPFGDVSRTAAPLSSTCRWAALAFLDGRFKTFAHEMSDEYLEAGARVLHPDNPAGAVQRFRELDAVSPEATSHVVAEGGWAVLRSGWDKEATVLAMPFSGSDKVFHSGWEMLSINLWSHGEPLLRKLLGYNGYMRGYPDGFGRTPRQANHVLLKGEPLRRVPGTLRNWFTSETLDYIHADHRGWRDGAVTARRRILFIKPDWVVIIDDIEGEGPAELVWQAHCDDVMPRISGTRATVIRGAGQATLLGVGSGFEADALSVEGTEKTVYLLKVEKDGALPIRFVTLVHVGPGDALAAETTSGERTGVRFSVADGPEHTVCWEPPGPARARCLSWASSVVPWAFVASDGNASPALDEMLRSAAVGEGWNGRVSVGGQGASAGSSARHVIDPADIRAFTYHGRLELTPVGTAGRVGWETRLPARHCVLYRAVGTEFWQRQFQPGLHKSAWILVPDLAPDRDYELRVVSEFEPGGISSSPVFTRRAPGPWKMF
ncbi:MAG: hypothetical protein HN742_13565 [Lentisphaerae bacterium]|jgi:hypothetical protein|nr:hypothetical protein [Lentisphaerota bacterium]MBT4819083.1 hypothetical protein [Lentisphaerota bacterium]MBT5606345.1 hypothetical protein [Lentisphaerota bacterium]MBT7056019.1 hypothetical protein [Lentisphaerota bacterium]MBT7842900.1 hypothetical protein [Lentisphaerota bacterium]